MLIFKFVSGGREIFYEGEGKEPQMIKLVFYRLTKIVTVPLCDLLRFFLVLDSQRRNDCVYLCACVYAYVWESLEPLSLDHSLMAQRVLFLPALYPPPYPARIYNFGSLSCFPNTCFATIFNFKRNAYWTYKKS